VVSATGNVFSSGLDESAGILFISHIVGDFSTIGSNLSSYFNDQ